MKKIIYLAIILSLSFACSSPSGKKKDKLLAEQIRNNEYFAFTKQKALDIMKSGFNAGDGYREVWIRDYNTFIELAGEVHPAEELKENLLVFFRMQGEDGNIIDGFTPIDTVGKVAYDFYYTDLEPRYAGHKNSVETDQESSLVQAVWKYIEITGDKLILSEQVAGKSVADRLEWAMQYLMDDRFNKQYGLIFGATTADWGDVQPEHGWGGDWTWFGGRMIQQLIRYGFIQEAYEQVQPMVKRMKDNNGFYEWYSVNNEPRGSGTFRGEAGVLFKAIRMLESFAEKY